MPGAITSATYDAANELTNWNGTAISYDLNGNMLGDGMNAFTWNARNQVATLNSVGLQYDAFGRRIRNAAGTSFLYDGPNATQELSGATPTGNIWTGGIDELFQRSDGNEAVTPLADALGSVIALVNSSGSAVTTYSYDPFGNTTITGAASSNPAQYTGRENEGNGLYFYRARYYEVGCGRFVSEDPIRFSGGVNFYAYAENDPINTVDPSGLRSSNPFVAYAQGVQRNYNYAANWLFETQGTGGGVWMTSPENGKRYIFYGTNTDETQDMMQSAGGIYMQMLYKYRYGCHGSPQNNNFSTIPAYLTETPSLGNWGSLGSTAFEIGAFSFDINDLGNGMVRYRMYNKSGWHSLLGGLNFDYGDHELPADMPIHEQSGYGGNVRQMFEWIGPKPCDLSGRK